MDRNMQIIKQELVSKMLKEYTEVNDESPKNQ